MYDSLDLLNIQLGGVRVRKVLPNIWKASGNGKFSKNDKFRVVEVKVAFM